MKCLVQYFDRCLTGQDLKVEEIFNEVILEAEEALS